MDLRDQTPAGSQRQIYKIETSIICPKCGFHTKVNFIPLPGRLVLCQSCFELQASGR